MLTHDLRTTARARLLVAGLAAAAGLAGCAGQDETQTLEGRVDLSNFSSRVLGVRALQGDEPVATTSVAADGRFQLDVPRGHGYRLEVVTATGGHGFLTSSGGQVRSLTFDVCGAQDPYDVGDVNGWDQVKPDGTTGDGGGDGGTNGCPPGEMCDPCQLDPASCPKCDDTGTCCYPDGTCCYADGTCCDPNAPDGCNQPPPPPPCDPMSDPNCCDPTTGEMCPPPPPCDPATDPSCCDPTDPDGGCYCNPDDPMSDCYCNADDPASQCYCSETDPNSMCYCNADDPASGCYCDKTDPNSWCNQPPPCDPATDPNCCDPMSDPDCSPAGGGCSYDDMNDPSCWPQPCNEPCKTNADASMNDVCWSDGVVAEQPIPSFGCDVEAAN